jgi:hypothetical protein
MEDYPLNAEEENEAYDAELDGGGGEEAPQTSTGEAQASHGVAESTLLRLARNGRLHRITASSLSYEYTFQPHP